MDTQEEEYCIRIEGQPLLKDGSRRWFDTYYSVPTAGVNKQTGILLVCGGYGSKIDSNIYKKIRRMFRDRYNMIIVQCDYFGYTYMNNDFMYYDYIPPETPTFYNEMGVMQAMDHLCAIWEIMKIMSDAGTEFDHNKIIFYGHSHGAYLGYLCNALAPKLFSAIVENSAYLYPYHIDHPRRIPYLENGVEKSLDYTYLISELIEDKEIYDLNYIYKRVNNEALILAFHGTEDTMVPVEEKKKFMRTIKNCCLHIVTLDDVDQRMFYSAKHSLHADFLQMFDFVVENYRLLEAWGERGKFSALKYRTSKFRYIIDLNDGKPIMKREGYHKSL